LRAAANASTGRELAYLANAVGKASREDEKMTGITPVALTCRQPQHFLTCFCVWKRTPFVLCKKGHRKKQHVVAFSLLNRQECVNRFVAMPSLLDRHVCTSKQTVFENKV